jgi:8-oxo-dGTP pyrophosphatase MutT (NUDIX family)
MVDPALVYTGGVLVLFYEQQGRLHLPLIQRPTYEGVHSGQVALPGGGRENSDADLTATALREAYEEIGVPPGEVTVLGRLTKLYIHPSNYVVTPTVAWTPQRPAFRLDPYEVAALLEVPGWFMVAPRCGSEECEGKVKAETRATIRYLPLEQRDPGGPCIVCGQRGIEEATWAQAY